MYGAGRETAEIWRDTGRTGPRPRRGDETQESSAPPKRTPNYNRVMSSARRRGRRRLEHQSRVRSQILYLHYQELFLVLEQDR